MENTFFSHHQKQVVIANELAFVGRLTWPMADAMTPASASSSCVPPQHAIAPGELTHYVSEVDLLKTTSSAGWLSETAQAGEATGQWAADTPIGKLVDGVCRWWNEPIPDWLGEPVKDIAQAVQPLLYDAKAAAMAKVIRKLRDGSLKPEHITAVLAKVAAVMKASYVALLGMAWATRKPHAELFKPGAILRADQPRQPWQDVHCSAEGPATYDLATNFIRRWNSLEHSYLPAVLRDKVKIPAELIPQEPALNATGPGTASVRVLRSSLTCAETAGSIHNGVDIGLLERRNQTKGIFEILKDGQLKANHISTLSGFLPPEDRGRKN